MFDHFRFDFGYQNKLGIQSRSGIPELPGLNPIGGINCRGDSIYDRSGMILLVGHSATDQHWVEDRSTLT